MIKGRSLGPLQAIALIYCPVVGYGIILAPRLVFRAAGSSAPLLVVVGLVITLIALQLFLWVYSKHPKEELLQLLESMLGRPLALSLVSFLILYAIAITAFQLRGYANLLALNILMNTPLWVIVLTMWFLSVYGAYSGIEVILRFFTVVMFIELFVFLPTPLLNFQFTYTFIQPWLPNTVSQLVGGTSAAVASLFGFEAILFVYPLFAKQEMVRRYATAGMVLAGLIIVGLVTAVLMLFGVEGVSRIEYPLYVLYQSRPYSGFIQRLAPVFFLVWSMGIFKLGMLYLYAGSVLVKQVTHISNYRAALVPVAAVAFTVALLPTDRLQAERLLALTATCGSWTLVGLSVVLALVQLIRRRRTA